MKNFLKSKVLYSAIGVRLFIYLFLQSYAENVKQLPFFSSRMTNFEEFDEAKFFIDRNLHPY